MDSEIFEQIDSNLENCASDVCNKSIIALSETYHAMLFIAITD